MLATIVPASAIAARSAEMACGGRPPAVTIATSTFALPEISSKSAMPCCPNRPSAQVTATAIAATNATNPSAGTRAIGLPGAVGASDLGDLLYNHQPAPAPTRIAG